MVEVEWLVLCRGYPARHGWTHQTRVDALARIARAALSDDSPCHLLFEDCTLLSLSPSFAGAGRPWGEVFEASEKRFFDLLMQLSRGTYIPGAQWNPPRPRQHCFRDLIVGRFGLIMEFREYGNFLLGHSLASSGPGAEGAGRPLPRTLCVIGGVRDAFQSEERALEEASPDLWARRCTVSLGLVPELTSKCIKAISSLHGGCYLEEAIRRCLVEGAPAPALPVVGNIGATSPLSHRPPLHIVVKCSSSLSDFVVSPVAATMVVDVFRASCDSHKRTMLTLLGAEGDALTLHQAGKCLAESDAIEELERQLPNKRRADLKQVLLDGQNSFRSEPRQVRVLHADESLPVLAPAPLHAVVPGVRDTVAVIFGSAADATAIRCACSAIRVRAYVRAGTGGLLQGPAYACILHSAGLLSPALTSPPPTGEPWCPTVRRECPTVRRPAPPALQRGCLLPADAAGSASTSSSPPSWAKVVRGSSEEEPKKPVLLSVAVKDLEGGSATPAPTPATSDLSPVPSTHAPSECSDQVEDWEERALDSGSDSRSASSSSRAAAGHAAAPAPSAVASPSPAGVPSRSSGNNEVAGISEDHAVRNGEADNTEAEEENAADGGEEAVAQTEAPTAARSPDAPVGVSAADGEAADAPSPEKPGTWADVARRAAASGAQPTPGKGAPRPGGAPPRRRPAAGAVA